MPRSPGRHLLSTAWGLAAGLIAAVVAFTAWPAAAQTAVNADTAGPVRGLIVRLKNPPPHERLLARGVVNDRERALARSEFDQESTRWRRVLGEAGMDGSSNAAVARRLPALRPVGRDQQLLSFERPLAGAEARALIQRLKARPDVDWVEVNTRERRLQTPTDPYFADGSQWWLQGKSGSNLNALADRKRGAAGFHTAWLQPGGTGSATVPIAVLDTGISPHPDLDARVLPGYDFVSDIKFGNDGDGRDADPTDPGDWVSLQDLTDRHFDGCGVASSSWHGTVIAGMVAAVTNNGEGAAAINWAGRVVPVRVAGKCGADKADIIDGMRWAAGLDVCRISNLAGACVELAPRNPNPVRIVNVSFGGDAACGADYQAAIDELKSLGVVVVAAAGNEHGHPTRPASCRDVVGVIGLNRDGFKTHYSNFGAALTASGIATPSGDDPGGPSPLWNALADNGILSTYVFGSQGPTSTGYAYLWGTSFAAPQVSGAIGLMLSVNPALTWEQIVQGLQRSARKHVTSPSIAACAWSNPGRCACTASTCGAGILDAAQALLYAANPTSYVAPGGAGEVIDHAELTAAAASGPDRNANPEPPPTEPPPTSGGGGALSLAWLLALALASAALVSARPRRHRA